MLSKNIVALAVAGALSLSTSSIALAQNWEGDPNHHAEKHEMMKDHGEKHEMNKHHHKKHHHKKHHHKKMEQKKEANEAGEKKGY